MIDPQYEKFKQQRDEEMHREREKARLAADEAFNRGLWNAVKWRNPLAYFILKKRS